MSIPEKIKELNPQSFTSIIPGRMHVIEQAPADFLPKDYPVNRLADALHPAIQHVKISTVREHGNAAKSFTLVPDEEKGTRELAWFSAGQYVSVFLEIGHLLRPHRCGKRQLHTDRQAFCRRICF